MQVRVVSLRYHGEMTDDTNAETWRFTLRGTAADRHLVQRVIDAHKATGLNISYNQAVLVLIRRSATPDADTQEEAWRQIEQHWAHCPHGCNVNQIRCPEGWRFRDAYHRVAPPTHRVRPTATTAGNSPDQQGAAGTATRTVPRTSATPSAPSPSPTPPPPTDQGTGWRRYFGFTARSAA